MHHDSLWWINPSWYVHFQRNSHQGIAAGRRNHCAVCLTFATLEWVIPVQAWRVLSRIHGSTLCYTPMIHAGLYSQASNTRYHREQFDLLSGEEGSFPLDRPVIAQFCANDKETFLAAASKLAEELEGDPQRRRRVCAVDLNLGCPQGIAKRGGYGAFLMEDWELISSLSMSSPPSLANTRQG